MGSRNFNIAVALTEFCLLFVCVVKASQDANCVCRGPTKYYEELGCTPVFKNPDDCCPMRYDCDIWKKLPGDKCLVNGHIYGWGERLREEDRNVCDSCACGGHYTLNGPVSTFSCVSSSCLQPNIPNGSPCYYRPNVTDCCGGSLHCLKENEVRPTCIVDGKTYQDGDYFVPSTEPEKKCNCGPGYSGKNVEPFCISPKHTWCSNVLHHIQSIRQSCAPTYNHESSPQKDCNTAFRCQNFMDRVISRTNETSDVSNSTAREPEDNMLCHFGHLKMRVGDELNQDTDYFSTCMRCVCEVPPVPTCQRRSQAECPDSEHGGL